VIVIDSETKNMLDAMNFKDLPGVQVAAEGAAARQHHGHRDRR
jgi:hypothetical protein